MNKAMAKKMSISSRKRRPSGGQRFTGINAVTRLALIRNCFPGAALYLTLRG
jgi:hypothetical protein